MKIACIGCGSMGSAFLKSIAEAFSDIELNVTAKHYENALNFSKSINKNKEICFAKQSNCEAVKNAKFVFLAVKPIFIKEVLTEITDYLREDAIIISMAAGVSLDDLYSIIPTATFVRIMPNTPCKIAEGMTALCYKNNINQDDLDSILTLIKTTGTVEIVDEKLMDCVTGVSGSGPAYAFMFIEAMADAAVLNGMPRKQAYIYACQTLKGAASLVLKENKHPAELKDSVCSPGGTTIEAVSALEENGFRNAIIKAVNAACNKSRSMRK